MSTETTIVFICAIGFGYSCWKAGIKQGADNCIELLHKKKIIRYDNKGDIKPNQFYQEED